MYFSLGDLRYLRGAIILEIIIINTPLPYQKDKMSSTNPCLFKIPTIHHSTRNRTDFHAYVLIKLINCDFVLF